jgi:hypothetical protein
MPKRQHNADLSKLVQSTLANIHAVDEDLYREAVWVADRIPSIPQQINLNKKSLTLSFDTERNPMDLPSFRGFPQRQITLHDWTNLKYLVLKISYADASIRDEFNQPSIVKLRIPSVLGATLNQMIDIQDNSMCSTNSTKSDMTSSIFPRSVAAKVPFTRSKSWK